MAAYDGSGGGGDGGGVSSILVVVVVVVGKATVLSSLGCAGGEALNSTILMGSISCGIPVNLGEI